MKVIPLAAESLGVRSMATYVEAGDLSILIDPGATLAPARWGLPPAEPEWEALRRANDRISAYAARARLVFVSHYHEDHFRSDPASYVGRTVVAKDPQRMVAGAQARRGVALWKALENAARVEAADGWRRRDGALELSVSPPLPHGVEGTPLGYVVALVVADVAQRERFVFASDVQGPLSAVAGAWLVQQRPTLLYLSGPPSYVESELPPHAVERGIDNLMRVMDASGCRVIMDHHALRDPAYVTRFERLWQTGRVVTAAAHLGLEAAPLEVRRRALWGDVRKPAAPIRRPAPARDGAAIMGRAARTFAKRGNAE
jgi:predicted metallo-beta-lactamase superfamily hydrolase